MKLIKRLFFCQDLNKETLYLIYLLTTVLILAYIIPTIIFQSPSGTDVYSHMYNTLRMANSNSMLEFYEKSFEEEYKGYDYPFGMWLFGSTVMKVTGMDIHELAYILPLILLIVSIFVYCIYAHSLLLSKNKAILASIFLVSMPLIASGMLNYSTSRFVPVFLIVIIYLSIDKPDMTKIFITVLMVFSLVFTHTGTYMFLMLFSIAYFILSALIWKKFDSGMYILIVSFLVLYYMAMQLFPYVQPQYIDKGRMVLSISESISSKLGLGFIKEMGVIFYERIFVANNLIYVFFWSSLIFVAAKFSLYLHLKVESLNYRNLSAIPLISGTQRVSHGITTAPFWLGPVHILLSIFGVFKLDARGKCIALSLVLTSLFPGSLQSGYGTGALREMYYLYLIIPISSASGFYYVISSIKNSSGNKIKNVLITMFFLLVLLSLILTPIIGSIYYNPTISGTKNEKENLIWLSKIGSPNEGAPGFAYNERIDLYANKLTPSIPSGSEMKRYLSDLRNTYFSAGAEEFTKDLNSFNIQYIISSDRTLKGFNESKDSLNIDPNKQLDKIYASDKNFGIYRYITSGAIHANSSYEEMELKLEGTKIQDFGSTYLVENEFYKIKLGAVAPGVEYIGTKNRNLLGEGAFSDNLRISWEGAYKERYAGYDLNELSYPYISAKDNTITYKTVVRDGNKTENWATLIVKYTFYEKAIKREITAANDWVSSESDLTMNLGISSSIFAPVTDFDINQIGSEEERLKARKIYPSQDSIIFKDKKFNEIYFNESDIGLFIKYSDLTPYPTRLSYRGSTIYEYGGVSMDSSFSLQPSESMDLVQYFSVGDKPAAKNNIEQYISVSPYMYPEAKMPVIITGYIDERDTPEYLSNAYKKLQEHNVSFNEGIAPANNITIRKEMHKEKYLFSWDEIPGKDSLRLVEFLKQNFGFDYFTNTPKIEKTDNGSTIRLSIEKNTISLKLNDEKTQAMLAIDDGRSDAFVARSEDGKLNLYKPVNTSLGKGTNPKRIMPANNISFRSGKNTVGFIDLYERQNETWKYIDLSTQNEEILNIKALGVNGMLFKSFKYNLDTIKASSDNSILFAEALTVPSPFMEFNREGLRYPRIAYYHGEETGVVLIPVTMPPSLLLSSYYDVENVFSQWNETLDSVVKDGGMAAFLWNANDIGNPEYIDRVMELINYSKSKGMSFTTPDEIAAHFSLLQKISANATKGIDYVVLDVANHNQEEVNGVTYRLELPILNNSCPYVVTNGRIPRQDIIEGNCRLYVSFDLKAEEQKEVKVEPNITTKSFEPDFSNVYEGRSIIKIMDDEGNPVDKASVYVDARWFETNQKGEVELTIRRGMHRISVEKPGFVSKDYEIEVKGRVYKLLARFR